jgi:hypothetical protein
MWNKQEVAWCAGLTICFLAFFFAVGWYLASYIVYKATLGLEHMRNIEISMLTYQEPEPHIESFEKKMLINDVTTTCPCVIKEGDSISLEITTGAGNTEKNVKMQVQWK